LDGHPSETDRENGRMVAVPSDVDGFAATPGIPIRLLAKLNALDERQTTTATAATDGTFPNRHLLRAFVQ